MQVRYDLRSNAHQSIENGSITVQADDAAAGSLSDATGVVSPALTIIPNPARPSNRVSEPFELKNKPWASNWTSSENAGVTLQFDFTAPAIEEGLKGAAAVPTEGCIAVYDIVGNRIAQTPMANLDLLFNGSQPTGTVKVYWNGRDLHGQKAAPGIYRAVLSYTSGKKSGAISGKIGIKW